MVEVTVVVVVVVEAVIVLTAAVASGFSIFVGLLLLLSFEFCSIFLIFI